MPEKKYKGGLFVNNLGGAWPELIVSEEERKGVSSLLLLRTTK